MQTTPPVWQQLLRLHVTSPLLFRVLIILIIVELLVIFIAPLLLPKHYYLASYLSSKAEKATTDFLHNEGLLIPDPITGWQNKPNTSRENWQIDAFGSRSHHPFAPQPSKPIRVLFIGSSMINGGTHIHNNETLSAYLEDANIEALNFGTMLYSFDQNLLKLEQLLKYKPTFVIMGVDSDPVSGLTNLYIPFRNSAEINMPYMKPRFMLRDNQLQTLNFEPIAALQHLRENDNILNLLQQQDNYYHRFNRFIHLGHTPLAGSLHTLLRKTESFLQYQNGNPEGEALLLLLMQKAQSMAAQHHFKLIFLSIPSFSDTQRGRLMQYFPDWYALRQQKFTAMKLPVIDAKLILINSKQSLTDLYTDDRVHFTAQGNKIIAEQLRKHIATISTQIQTP